MISGTASPGGAHVRCLCRRRNLKLNPRPCRRLAHVDEQRASRPQTSVQQSTFDRGTHLLMPAPVQGPQWIESGPPLGLTEQPFNSRLSIPHRYAACLKTARGGVEQTPKQYFSVGLERRRFGCAHGYILVIMGSANTCNRPGTP